MVTDTVPSLHSQLQEERAAFKDWVRLPAPALVIIRFEDKALETPAHLCRLSHLALSPGPRAQAGVGEGRGLALGPRPHSVLLQTHNSLARSPRLAPPWWPPRHTHTPASPSPP